MTTKADRKVITFYSYKGGVGRTMTLANVAWRLANKSGFHVIVADWDLEAPGLHRFFGITDEQAETTPGILEFLEAWKAAIDEDAETAPDLTPWLLDLPDDLKPKFGSVRVLTAGKQTDDYSRRISGFDWREFYDKRWGAAAVETLRKQLIDAADAKAPGEPGVVLVDSRTGITDLRSICTVQLPDGVVLMTTPTEQGLKGTERTARLIRTRNLQESFGRSKATVWFVLARLPSWGLAITRRWIGDHESWWLRGVEGGLWEPSEHRWGLTTFSISHSDEWTIGENLLTHHDSERDQLGREYDELADKLAYWVRFQEQSLVLRLSENAASLPPEAKVLHERLTAARARRDVQGQADALIAAGEVRSSHGDRLGAVSAFLEATALCRALDDDNNTVWTAHLLARALLDAGLVDDAQAHALDAVGASRSLVDSLLRDAILAASLDALAACEYAAGRPDVALPYALESVELWRSYVPMLPPVARGLGRSLRTLGAVRLGLGDPHQAVAAAEEAVQLRRDLLEAEVRPDLGDVIEQADALTTLALAQSELGLAEAIRTAADAAELSDWLVRDNSSSHEPVLARSLRVFAVATMNGRPGGTGAWSWCTGAVGIYRRLAATEPAPFAWRLAESLETLGRIAAAEKNPFEAAKHFHEGLQTLAPWFQKYPKAHAKLARKLVDGYEAARRETGEPRDDALLAPILATLATVDSPPTG
ncbi:MAG: KGGVGR-motif variant AAA ATPase [Dehalococcoidia bacterium]